ncbi:MAG: hypothetical protein J6K46_08620 [Sutterella sp.]|nr:hypothetical protein [Sutterella sp.]
MLSPVGVMAPGQTVFGADAFFAPAELDVLMMRLLREMLSEGDFERIVRLNALPFFARG